MMKIILVMAGGFLGSISRYTLGEWTQVDKGVPVGTFLINIIGCFFLAWLLTFSSIRQKIRPQISLFLGTGFLGSFTTFSTFSIENVQLWQNGQGLQSVTYILISILCGIFSAFFGVKFAFYFTKEGDSK